jgi:hypothetical protein
MELQQYVLNQLDSYIVGAGDLYASADDAREAFGEYLAAIGAADGLNDNQIFTLLFVYEGMSARGEFPLARLMFDSAGR